jgi:uncharacterized membrane protein YdjX (TVP38/TMEM64 family)
VRKQKIFKIIIAALFLLFLIAMIVQLLPLVREVVANARDESSIVAYVDSFGWRGVPALVGLSALQVIIPIIPAPAVGVLAGLSYGIYWGPLIFLGGIAVGNLFVVVSLRLLHSLIIAKKPKKKSKYKEQLEKIKRPEIAAFFLTLIPWVSSTGPYLFAGTKVALSKYIIAVVAGSIPSTVLYVFLGDRISRGNYTTAIIIAAIVVVALVFILVFRKKIIGIIMGESDK